MVSKLIDEASPDEPRAAPRAAPRGCVETRVLALP
jgi:hypothetical protein